MRLLMEKLQSKKDVYNFLMQECEAYLPKMDTVNMFFLKQITSGKKEVSQFRLIRCSTLNGQGSRLQQYLRLMGSQLKTFWLMHGASRYCFDSYQMKMTGIIWIRSGFAMYSIHVIRRAFRT